MTFLPSFTPYFSPPFLLGLLPSFPTTSTSGPPHLVPLFLAADSNNNTPLLIPHLFFFFLILPHLTGDLISPFFLSFLPSIATSFRVLFSSHSQQLLGTRELGAFPVPTNYFLSPVPLNNKNTLCEFNSLFTLEKHARNKYLHTRLWRHKKRTPV